MKDSPLYPILYMAVLAAVFGAAVSSVAVATRERVTAGERAQLRSHVLSAFDLPVPEVAQEIERAWQLHIEQQGEGSELRYVARNDDGTLLGYGFPFQGQGFWGPIHGVVAVDPAGEQLLGIAFTQHQETPGLGGRITEPWFRNQFRGKLITPPDSGGPPLAFVQKAPSGPREVEAITGATQTSSRLDRFLNRFLVDLAKRDMLREGGGA